MERKAVLSRNAFLLGILLICMQRRITVLGRVTYRDTTAEPFIEKARETCHLPVMQTFKLVHATRARRR